MSAAPCIPAVRGTDECLDRTALGVVFYMGNNCADMMFSGHTALTFLAAPVKERFYYVIPEAICLVLGS